MSEPAPVEYPQPPTAPYQPPPSYPPPVGSTRAVTDGGAVASLLWAILGLIFGLPLGMPALIGGPVAYFLGSAARTRIAESNGALSGASTASAGRILGIITTIVGCLVTLLWLIVIFNALNDTSSGSSFS